MMDTMTWDKLQNILYRYIVVKFIFVLTCIVS
jgi:hypothetical protein